jgi:tetratricopeptide (TPR) repeat protein
MILRDYDKAIELAPDFSFAWFNRGNILCSSKDYKAAVVNFTNAINTDRDFAEAYFNRALTYIYIGDTDKGIADLSKAGELGIYQAYNLLKKLKK